MTFPLTVLFIRGSFGCSRLMYSQRRAKRPNIILITTDVSPCLSSSVSGVRKLRGQKMHEGDSRVGSGESLRKMIKSGFGGV